MDRTSKIDALRDVLFTAAGARDFERLGEAVRTLVPQLEALAAHGPWSAVESGALKRLRSAHELAAVVCDQQQQLVASRMQELQDNKAGWTAYAMEHETELDEDLV